MKKGIIILLSGLLIGLVSFAIWLNDNSTFVVTGLVAIFGVMISFIGLIVIVKP